MSDPTELVLLVSFLSALGLFIATALLRGNGPGSLPPRLPQGVAVWPYNRMDFLGMGFVFVLFFSLTMLGFQDAGEVPGERINPATLLVAIGFQFFIAGLVVIFVAGRLGLVEWLGLRWPGWKWVFLIAPATVLVMWMLFASLEIFGYMRWMESLGVEPVQDTVKLIQTSKDPVLLGLMAVAAVIAAPICEEIAFRGYLYPAAKKFAGPWVAGISSALVFAGAHGSLAALFPLFIFGCVLVLIYEKTKSLWAPIAVHFCFNGATVAVQLTARYFNIPLDPPT